MAIHSQNNYISLFSGGGGLDRAIRLAMPDAHCTCYVEREIGAVKILASYMAQKAIDDAPIWSDVRTFDGRRFRGRVAGICGGFPCTDLSVAGKRAGIKEGNASGLFYEYVRIIREVQPIWVAIENVPAVIAFPAGGTVLGELKRLGFDAVWGTLRASDVGASHIRKRVFVLAYREGFRWREGWAESAGIEGGSDVAERGRAMDAAAISRRSWRRSGESGAVRDQAWRQKSSGRCDDLAEPECAERWPSSEPEEGRERHQDSNRAGERSENLANAKRIGGERRRNGTELAATSTEEYSEACEWQRDGDAVDHGSNDLAKPSSERLSLSKQEQLSEAQKHNKGRAVTQLRRALFFAPGPSDSRWPDILAERPDLAPALSKFDWFVFELRRAGLLPDGLECTPRKLGRYLAQNVAREEIKRAIHNVADGLADRTDWLRALGNGVVPVQGAVALRVLMQRTGVTSGRQR